TIPQRFARRHRRAQRPAEPFEARRSWGSGDSLAGWATVTLRVSPGDPGALLAPRRVGRLDPLRQLIQPEHLEHRIRDPEGVGGLDHLANRLLLGLRQPDP